jgi:hypothetical protein
VCNVISRTRGTTQISGIHASLIVKSINGTMTAKHAIQCADHAMVLMNTNVFHALMRTLICTIQELHVLRNAEMRRIWVTMSVTMVT